MYKKNLPPIHPGEILLEEFLKPAQITQSKLATDLKVSFRRINEICQGKRPITIDTAGRLAIYFSLPEYFWLDLQQRYDYLCWEANKKIIQQVIKPLKLAHFPKENFLKKPPVEFLN